MKTFLEIKLNEAQTATVASDFEVLLAAPVKEQTLSLDKIQEQLDKLKEENVKLQSLVSKVQSDLEYRTTYLREQLSRSSDRLDYQRRPLCPVCGDPRCGFSNHFNTPEDTSLYNRYGR